MGGDWLGESCLMSAFTKHFFEKLGMVEIGPRGPIFQALHLSPKANDQRKTKEDDLSDLSPNKKKSESFDEN